MRRSPILLVALLAAACASDWTLVSAGPQPALKDGAELALYERGRGSDRERRAEIREGGAATSAESVEDLVAHVRPLDTPDAAIAYADLVRLAGTAGTGAVGMAVTPDASLQGPGGSGRYSRADAQAWGVPFEPTARPSAGGIEVAHVVLLPPVPHHSLPRAASPWRLVLLREIVFRDGTLRAVEERTLTNGNDAARYAGR